MRACTFVKDWISKEGSCCTLFDNPLSKYNAANTRRRFHSQFTYERAGELSCTFNHGKIDNINKENTECQILVYMNDSPPHSSPATRVQIVFANTSLSTVTYLQF